MHECIDLLFSLAAAKLNNLSRTDDKRKVPRKVPCSQTFYTKWLNIFIFLLPEIFKNIYFFEMQKKPGTCISHRVPHS